MQKAIGAAVVLLVVLYVIAQPTNAADMANGTWHLATKAGHSLTSFVNHLGS